MEKIMRQCPVCQKKSEPKKVESAGKYSILHCPVCDVMYADPFRGPGAEWYEKSEMYTVGRVITKSTEWYHRAVLKLRPKGKTLLDIGCGTGIFLSEAKKLGYDVWGIDFDENNIAIARNKYKLDKVFCYSVAELKNKFGKHQFDIVTFFEVLEHLDKPKDFLGDLKDLLAPGGIIALSVPNRNRLIDTIGSGDLPPNHLTRWSSSALRKFLDTADYEVVTLIEKPLNSEDIRSYLKSKIRFGVVHGLIMKGLEANDSSSIRKAGYLMNIKDSVFAAISLPPGAVCSILKLQGSGLICTARPKA